MATAAIVLPITCAQAAPASDTPRDPLVTTQSRSDAVGKGKMADVQGPPADTEAADDSESNVQGTTLYGPPAPKVQHGKLADIEWPKAPDSVPPALETAVNIVTRNYPSARSGRSALRAAASDVKAAKWLQFPSISGNVAYLDSDNSPDPQLIVEQPLWSGGRISANIRRAKAAEDAQSAEYVGVVEQLALATANTYFQIAQLTDREQLLADSLKEHLRLVETMEHRVEQEVSPLADLELARSRAAQIEQDYTVSRSQRETALRVFAELVADPSYDLGPVPIYSPSLELDRPEALEDQSVAFDASLRRLSAQADVARADLETRKAAILPQVSAQYSYSDFYGSRLGVVARAQTSGGFSELSQINGARLRIQSALQNRQQAEQQLRREIASDIIAFQAARARASISTRASDTASRVSESYVRQFIAGRRSWLDVMNALREAVNAQIGKTDAQYDAMAANMRLLLRSGRWRPKFDLPEKEDRDSETPMMGQM